MVAASIQRPFDVAVATHGAASMTASSQGGLAMLAIAYFRPLTCFSRGMRKHQIIKQSNKRVRHTLPVDEVSALSPDSIATAITEEEPLPVVIAEMALWGAGISALMIPIGIMGLMAAPFAAVGNIFRPAPEGA